MGKKKHNRLVIKISKVYHSALERSLQNMNVIEESCSLYVLKLEVVAKLYSCSVSVRDEDVLVEVGGGEVR